MPQKLKWNQTPWCSIETSLVLANNSFQLLSAFLASCMHPDELSISKGITLWPWWSGLLPRIITPIPCNTLGGSRTVPGISTEFYGEHISTGLSWVSHTSKAFLSAEQLKISEFEGSSQRKLKPTMGVKSSSVYLYCFITGSLNRKGLMETEGLLKVP